MKNFIPTLVFCFLFQTLFAQNSDTIAIQTIKKSISDYFQKDRENIHVHFSKDVYFLEEQLSFKGYVYHQQSQNLFESTTNVFVEIFNINNELVLRKLLFANKGIFEHTIVLDQQLHSGKYYFRFYTNYMNNFSEDLSSTYVLTIVNSKEQEVAVTKQVDVSKINITVYPESGVFLSGIRNRMSVKVTDCFGNGLEVKNVKVLDKQQREVVNFYTNSFGYGNFELLSSNQQDYSILLESNGKNFTQKMPEISYSGISVMVNSYAFSDKTLFNLQSKNIDVSKKYFLVIHQNGKSVVNPVDFKDKLEWTFFIENKNLFNGVNTVRLIDEDLNQLSERIFFLNKRAHASLSILKNNDQENILYLSGKSDQSLALLSTSVLPGNSKSYNLGRNIINSLLIDPYIGEKSRYDFDYFTDNSKNKNFDLDLFFRYQKSNTNWTTIRLKNWPNSYYSFDNGISLKGRVDQELNKNKNYNVHLFSLQAGLNEFATLNNKREFEFKNLILADSAWVNFRLIDSDRKPVVLKTSINVLDNDKPFAKPLNLYPSQECRHQNEAIVKGNDDDFPVFKDAITLKAVEVKNTERARQDKLTKLNESDNILLKGYKGSDLVSFRDMMLVDFLKSKGFNVVSINGQQKIIARYPIVSGYKPTKEEREAASYASNRQPNYPQIIIDDFEQMSHDFLISLRMTQIDEIYYDRRVTVGTASSNRGYEGMIKVYTKVPESLISENFTLPFQIKKGFSKNYAFKNNVYALRQGEGFEKYGIVQWKPNLDIDPNGVFQIKVPSLERQSIEVFTEGVAPNGTLISERKNIDLER